MGIIKEIIKKSGVSQTEIARRLDYTEANLSYLKNRNSAFVKKVKDVMNELNIDTIEAEESGLHFTIKVQKNGTE